MTGIRFTVSSTATRAPAAVVILERRFRIASPRFTREAGLDVGLTWAVLPALLAEPSGDLAGLVRAEELVDPA